MKRPFWRCAIISLLLWALPMQWLAAATLLPCAGHAKAQGEISVLVKINPVHAAPGHAHQHQPHHQQVPAHAHGEAPAHGSMLMAHADADTTAVPAHGAASADSHAKCASAGHCCLSAALLPAPMPEFAQRGAAVQFAPLAQPHRTPLLSGLDRPPQTHLA